MAFKLSDIEKLSQDNILNCITTNYDSAAFEFCEYNGAMNLTAPESYVYSPDKTGVYCIYLSSLEGKIDVINPFGITQVIEYPYLPFYQALSIIYLIYAVFWLIKTAFHYHEILPIQNYIAVVLFVLLIDNSLYYGYYQHWNITGTISQPILYTAVVLNSIRNSLSLFVLLIVCLGYGVVKPSLGETMRKCMTLAGVFFVSFVIFDILIVSRETGLSALLALMVIMPLSISLTLFFAWTQRALKETIIHLDSRRQIFKKKMYLILSWTLRFAAFIMFIFIMIFLLKTGPEMNQFYTPSWMEENMRSFWFFKDGWMNLLYLLCLTVIIIVWRPTNNNARYGLEELPDNESAAYDLEVRSSKTREEHGNPSSVIYELEDDESPTASSRSRSPDKTSVKSPKKTDDKVQ
jgi:hypothetical protein